MKGQKKHWLIIYDIREPRRLQKVAKKMTGYALRVQQSVFEMDAPLSVLEQLRLQIKNLMEEDDFVVFFNVCEQDWQKRRKYGKGKHLEPEDKSYYIY